MHLYKETLKTLRGKEIVLTAAPCTDICGFIVGVDIWGRIEGKGNPIYPPRFPTKSIKEFGSVENYKNSPKRELFYHCSHGQLLAFKIRALNYFKFA